jgi:hypothetical protein
LSIAQSEPAVSLRRLALDLHERLVAEAEARKRREAEEERGRLIGAARLELQHAFGQQPHQPESPFTARDFRAATIAIASTDDDVARVEFQGELFEYRSEQGDPHQLYHVWTCPDCGQVWELPTRSNQINSLADLGAWLAHAPTVHVCEARP